MFRFYSRELNEGKEESHSTINEIHFPHVSLSLSLSRSIDRSRHPGRNFDPTFDLDIQFNA